VQLGPEPGIQGRGASAFSLPAKTSSSKREWKKGKTASPINCGVLLC